MRRGQSISIRFLLLAFLPVGMAVIGGFLLFQRGIENSVRLGLVDSVRDAQLAQSKLRAQANKQELLAISALAENTALKAGLTLWQETQVDRPAARRTVEDQLREMGETLQADLLAVLDTDRRPVAALIRTGELRPLSAREMDAVSFAAGVPGLGGEHFELTRVPVNLGDANLGWLAVGRRLDLSSYHRQAVLLKGEKAAGEVGVGKPDLPALALQIRKCRGECEVTLRGNALLAILADGEAGGEHSIWTLHSIEAASQQLLGTARQILSLSLISILVAALLAHVYGVRSVMKPLAALIAKLRESEQSGALEGNMPEDSSTREVNELTHAYNRAARSVADSQRRLDEAYLQFTQSMAQTLDARDPYTAGHSSRVSDYAVAVAQALSLSANEIETVRVGSILHDIGKIGIPDAVLQKPAALDPHEYEIIKRHPLIGKRILEGVARFRDYLSIVELHHENHDGTGYPWGLQGENVPLAARIVHVVDAFDAMTTSRPYRPGMSKETALTILRKNAGSQFDPALVEVFLRLVQADPAALPAEPSSTTADLGSLRQSLEDYRATLAH